MAIDFDKLAVDENGVVLSQADQELPKGKLEPIKSDVTPDTSNYPKVIRHNELDHHESRFKYLRVKKTLRYYPKEAYNEVEGNFILKGINPILLDNSFLLNRKREENPPENPNSLISGHLSGHSQDISWEYGELAKLLQTFLEENREPHWKRDVADIIGTTYRDQAFIKLVQRWSRNDGKTPPKIRILHGGDKIQWINTDWQSSRLVIGSKENVRLPLSLPFGAEKYVATLKHSEIVLAGDIGSGKTHWGYELANLNVGKLPIRHFFNEMGDGKAELLLEDYPLLLNSLQNGYELINLDKEGLSVVDNLDPDGLNIFDYLHLPASKEWFLWLNKELATLSKGLDGGIVVVMLQKKRGQALAFGGDTTRMQCEAYFTLNIIEDIAGDSGSHGYKLCRVDITKCRDWSSERNPERYSIDYKTAPKYGKLIADGGWYAREDKAKEKAAKEKRV